MSYIVGIDLGTTYSGVAIPEERSDDGFFTLRECPGCSIIMDKHKNRITPSVVAENNRGEIVVGQSAKGRAGLTPEPIMFAKRHMGKDKTYKLAKQGTLSPVDVSMHILKYLKKMAEERLGEPVNEAVITVPAYFPLKAKQMTEEAGKRAGLKVAQIAPEPVAAALMYFTGDTRDPLRIMTYDLGGGTFDVAILEKKGGILGSDSILVFDGDPNLGGYIFDKLLANWIIDRLNEGNYDLKLDHNDPNDKAIFTKFMVIAERVKIKLSEKEGCFIQEYNTGITDHSDEPISIDLEITRDEFEEMIKDEIEYTIKICRRAMEEKADIPIDPAKIDEFIMVGGSSEIPLVARRLEEEFGKKPKLIEPNLCVALGAAIFASTEGKTYGCLKLDPVPAETELQQISVTGRIVPGSDLSEVEGCNVKLRAKDGSYGKAIKVKAGGGFVFQNIPLALKSTTDFIISASTGAGVEVTSHRFSVTQTDEPATTGLIAKIPKLLSKPIGIRFREGFYLVAPARTPLSFETVVQAETADTSGKVRISIIEENYPLGEVVVENVPTTLPVGSKVEITLAIHENYSITGKAYIPSLALKSDNVVINIPIPPQKSREELRRDYEMLLMKAQNALQGASTVRLFDEARGTRLKDRLEDCKKMFEARDPDLARIQDCLDEIETLIREITAGWKPNPPRSVFDQKAQEARELLARAIKQKPKILEDGYDDQLEAIQERANNAYKEQNAAMWKDSFKKLGRLCDELYGITRPADAGQAPPDPAQILLSLARELENFKKQVKNDDKERYFKFEQDFKNLSDDLKKIDPKSPDAMIQIRDWYVNKFGKLKEEVEKSVQEDKDIGVPRKSS
ncbi:MAG: Hsp70 family protein [Candidatus Eremiobacteraeota bacterium]|nr:Hsp70 family protein [Candidatus Eremiobacteraeota bacterium]